MNKRIFTIPNILDFIRILSAPVIMWLIINGYRDASLIVLGIAVTTDLFDGFIARKLNQISKLGSYMDPIADKLLFTFVFVGICIKNNLTNWLIFFGIFWSLFIIIFLVILPIFKKKGIKVNLLGKVSIFINCIILFILVYGYIQNWLLFIFAFFLLLPQVVYFFYFIKK